ncbi:MAG TPA: prepilin-type N-terminal cleavage/methylation domain-containing protein [Pyrinomonadaceae bacterium]|nr:prepilin-type N-terminal cleavage/methylation domain-containing protein [Pyrinomonadaceae bacterium]
MKNQSQKQAKSTARSVAEGTRGFTLLETTIALVVMMVVALGAASLFVYAVGANSTARDRELSMAVAQQQMERLRNASFANLEATVSGTGGAAKTVESGGRQYSVTTAIAETVAGDASRKTITVQVTPQGSTATTGIQRIFGGVTLVTHRATNAVGPFLVP